MEKVKPMLDNLFSLLNNPYLSDAQRKIIVNTMDKPTEYQQWFLAQFTRNR